MKIRVLSAIALIVVALGVPAAPATATAVEDVDPQVAYALQVEPGGIAVDYWHAVWPDLDMTLTVQQEQLFVAVAVGSCASGRVCAFNGYGAPGSFLSWAGDTSITDGATAPEVLATLPVKGRAAKTGYDRELFGQRWLDVDRNGCDTRNDILFRDLTSVTRAGTCRVVSGTLTDPFTGRVIAFTRGQDTSALVQIDHVVALSDAWHVTADGLCQSLAIALRTTNAACSDSRSVGSIVRESAVPPKKTTSS